MSYTKILKSLNESNCLSLCLTYMLNLIDASSSYNPQDNLHVGVN